MQQISIGAFFRVFLALARPYWVSQERWPARGLLALVVTLALSLVYVSVLINRWNNLFFNAIGNHDVTAFVQQLLHFCVLAILFVAIAIHQTYFTQLLEIRWRRWLTEHTIERWLEDQTYYRLQLRNTEMDNPDQRIAEDLRLFVGVTLTLGMGFLSSLVTVVSFVAILWSLSGVLQLSVAGTTLHIYGFMVWAALLYAMIGTWVTHLIGDPLIQLSFAQQSFEANFRFTLVRLRENAEGVAFYRGEADEARNFANRFGAVFRNWRGIMKRQKRISSFTIAYAQVALVFPFLAAAPRYLAGAITLGGLTQSVAAFTQLQGALSWFVNVYGSIAEWRATIARLNDFGLAIEHGRERRKRQMSEAPVIPDGPERRKDYIRVMTNTGQQLLIDDLTVNLPDGRPLLTGVSICIDKGQSVMLVGPSGSGKTTWLRAVAELWPFGHGRIVKPAEGMLFVPQRAYLPVGTLTEVVSYPAGAEKFSEAAVREALTLCGLAHLNDRLAESQNWALKLPNGEQQRIAFARAVLLRPAWLLLDEATSALDAKGEAELYEMIKKQLPDVTLISISHHHTLAEFHDRRFETRAAAEGWIMVESAEVTSEVPVPA